MAVNINQPTRPSINNWLHPLTNDCGTAAFRTSPVGVLGSVVIIVVACSGRVTVAAGGPGVTSNVEFKIHV